MDGPGPSFTARRVAAYRLGFERVAWDGGDAAAEVALAADVAAGVGSVEAGPMARYLRARTTFFDRCVVSALERGVRQFVSLGAGYDGRSLRYGGEGLCWFEVDRAVTQQDKRERVARLGISTNGLRFVAHDLADPGLAEAVRGAGYQPDRAGLIMCEGVIVYLAGEVVTSLLTEARALAGPVTRLALSTSAQATDSERRDRFRRAVAGLGEPADTFLGPEELQRLLDRTGWAMAETSDAARRAGLVVALPVE